MTPEQKAFYEYGGTWESACLLHRAIRLKIKGGTWPTVLKVLHKYRDERTSLGEIIRDAWQKRAACRRTCAECETYRNELKDSYGTIWCDYIHNYTRGKNKCVGCPFFEPRKEGE